MMMNPEDVQIISTIRWTHGANQGTISRAVHYDRKINF